jgi:2-polyprenyl-3-methyl-5-hydroxy-6-metoxy-1,4-benzoquinol methylase
MKKDTPNYMKENDIRPVGIFEEYLRLAQLDAYSYFPQEFRNSRNCPACFALGNPAFSKFGFNYDVCKFCDSLFVNPLPPPATFVSYYTESPSSTYWASTFYKETSEARREKLWKPKAHLILELMEKFSATQHLVVDIGGGFGIFAEELLLLGGKSAVIVEPGPQLAQVCREKGFQVVEKFLENVQSIDLPIGPKLFVSFELFEHLHDPEDFLVKLNHLMSPGDLFVLTTLSSTGLDIQVLWEDSKSVTPPHHINFLNPRAIEILLSRIGHEVLQITTPGKLDVDILSNNVEKITDRFWKTFITKASPGEKLAMQEFLATEGWSSHMMSVSRKP